MPYAWLSAAIDSGIGPSIVPPCELAGQFAPVRIRLTGALIHLLHLGLNVVPGLFQFMAWVLHLSSLLGVEAFHKTVVL